MGQWPSGRSAAASARRPRPSATPDLDDVLAGQADAVALARQWRDPQAYSEWGRHRRRRPRRRRLQSRSLCLRRDDACRSSRRAACACGLRSGAPHDRAVHHRPGRRGRLPQRRSGPSRRQARRAVRRSRSRACDPAELRSARRVRAQPHRMPRHPAPRTQSLRSRHGGARRSSRSAGQARSRGACASSAA